MGCEVLCALALVVLVGSVYGQGFQVPYGLRGFSRGEGGNSGRGTRPGNSDTVFMLGDTNNQNLGSQTSFSSHFSDLRNRFQNLGSPNIAPQAFLGQFSAGSSGGFRNLGSKAPFSGQFSAGTSQTFGSQSPFSEQFSAGSSQGGNFVNKFVNAGQLPGSFVAGSAPQSNLIGGQGPFFQSFQNQGGVGSQGVLIQGQFPVNVGQASSGFSTRPISRPVGQAFSASRRVVTSLPHVTLTRTVTQDRFLTTTDVAFVEQPRTATIFSIFTQTAVTTLVIPTPVDRTVAVSTALVTRAPVTVTVTDVRSEFQYVTHTGLQQITLTHTSYRFTQDTLVTTVTRVQTVSTTVIRTDVNTVTTTFTDIRTITSTVFPSYH